MNTHIHQLTTFLRKHGVYAQFAANVLAQNDENVREYFCVEEPTMMRAQSMIMYAFSWVDTPEGHHFWNSVHNKWREHILITEKNK